MVLVATTIVAHEMHGEAVYRIGPLLGGAIAAALWRWVLLPKS